MLQRIPSENSDIEYVHGVVKVLSAPKINRGRTTVCSFAAETERYPVDGKTANGRQMYENKVLTCTAFGKLAEYFALLEKNDIVLIYGRYEKDQYWTERNEKGEVQYKIIAEYAAVQPQDASSGYDNGSSGGYSGGYYDEPPY